MFLRKIAALRLWWLLPCIFKLIQPNKIYQCSDGYSFQEGEPGQDRIVYENIALKPGVHRVELYYASADEGNGAFRRTERGMFGLAAPYALLGGLLLFMSTSVFPWDYISGLSSLAAILVSSLGFTARENGRPMLYYKGYQATEGGGSRLKVCAVTVFTLLFLLCRRRRAKAC